MNAKQYVGTLLASLLLFTGSVLANPYIACNGCGYIQMRSAALAHGQGRILIGNVPGHKLLAFLVYSAPQPQVVGQPTSLMNHLYADLDNVSLEESDAFVKYTNLYDAAGGLSVTINATLTLNKANSVGPLTAYNLDSAKPKIIGMQANTGNINAFDIVSTPVYRSQVAAQIPGLAIQGWANLPNNIHLAILGVLNTIGIGKVISSPLTMTVNVVFADGTRSSFQWDSVNNAWTYVVGSSKDGSGNPIPDTAAAASGAPSASQQNYIFPGNVYGLSDGLQQINNMNGMGIGISAPVNSRGSSWGISCTTVSGGSRCVTYWPN